jgi:gliding motility-associated-like protein
MQKFLLTSVFTIFLVFTHQAQQFQRVLAPGRLSPGLDIDQKNKNEVGILSFVAGPNLFSGGFANLTTLNVEQGTVSSFDYRIAGTNLADGRAAWWPTENSWLLGVSALSGIQNKAVLKIAADGSVSWSKGFGEAGDVQEVNIGRTAVAITNDNKAVMAGAANNFALNDGRNDLFVAKINADGSSVWEKQLRFSLDFNADASLGGILSLPDGSLIISGTVNRLSSSDDLFLLKLDAQGNLLWAKQYGSPGNILTAKERGLDCAVMPNGHIVMCGWVDTDLAFNQDGLLLETDEQGNFVRSLSFDINNADFSLQVNRVIAIDNERVVFSVGASENINPTSALELNIMAEIKMTGEINWQRNYFNEILAGFGTAGDALITRNQNGGYLMLANDAVNFESLRPVLISTDTEGRTGCEKPVSMRIIPGKNFTVRTLSPVVVSVNTSKDVVATSTAYRGYSIDLPKLDLGPDTSFCSDKSLILNALVPGAEKYTWNTGATTATIEVDSSGLFIVEASSLQQCFILSDSVVISLNKLPTVEIELDSSGFCKNGVLNLNAKASAQNELLWSTGEKSDAIEVKAAGTYSVEAKTVCGTIKAEINLELPECPKDCPIFVPNVFSPNNDGTNDQFGPLGGECFTFRDYRFRIYSRWGELVYESRSASEKWDGTLNGKISPMDVYIWTFEYKTNFSETVRQTGDVSLLR